MHSYSCARTHSMNQSDLELRIQVHQPLPHN